MELYKTSLDIKEITARWYDRAKELNYGAFITFIGTIREENNIKALSFDIYEPLLKKWFKKWEEKAKNKGAIVKMAHSIGDVKIHESSFIAAVISPKRKVALKFIEEFVEDFKANAPIWKYDVINGKRVYAKDRSTPINGAGILGEFRND